MKKREKQLNFAIEAEIHESLAGLAERRGWPMAQLVREYLRRGLEQDGVTIVPSKKPAKPKPPRR